jgi:hypothetical protein
LSRYGRKTTLTFMSALRNERKHNFIICDVRIVISEVNNENEFNRVTKPYILGEIKNYPRPIEEGLKPEMCIERNFTQLTFLTFFFSFW